MCIQKSNVSVLSQHARHIQPLPRAGRCVQREPYPLACFSFFQNIYRYSSSASSPVSEPLSAASGCSFEGYGVCTHIQPITDTMGDYIVYNGFAEGDITGPPPPAAAQTGTTVTWSLSPKAEADITMTDPVQTVTEETVIGVDGTEYYTRVTTTTQWYLNAAEVVYNVYLDVAKAGFTSGTVYDVNGPTALNYTYDNAPKSLTFPVPKVRGTLYDIQFKKEDSATGIGLAGAVFTLVDADNIGWPATASGEADGVWHFTGLPTGTYTLTEVTPPAGYELPATNTWTLNIGYTEDLKDGQVTDHIHDISGNDKYIGQNEACGHWHIRNDLASVSFTLAEFVLHHVEGLRRDDGGMAVFYIILRNLAFIDLHLFREKIHAKGFLQNRIALVFLILQNAENGSGLPDRLARRCQNTALSTTFNNSYEATGRVHVTAMKYLSGRALADGQFSFTLTPVEGAPGTEQTKTNNAAGQVVFEDLCFCEADLGTTIVTNTYALRYLNGTTGLYEDTLPPGATDNGDGTWTYTPPGGDPVIYTAYYVNVADENDAHTTLPEGAVDNGDGTWTVTTETQNTTADFTYTITEVTGSAAGYTYDSHTETITVTVVDNGDGTMTATATYDADGAVFNNSYAAAGSVSLGGIKTVTGRAIAAEQFTFNLLDSGNNVIRTAKNDAAGNYTFSALSYTQSDAGKTYTYTIVEVNDGQGGYTYDSKVCTVTVSITDNGDGTLTVTPNYSPNANFNNTYAATGSAVIGGTKTLNGRALAAYQFTFNLLDSGDNVIQTAKNDAAGNYTFAAIHYTLADLGSHTYTIVEADDGQPGYTYDNKEITVTVNVTDNGDGTLTATPSYSPDANFTNNYAATGSVTIGGRKTLNGRIPAANRFTFNLLDSGDNVIRTAQNNASGSFTFDVIQYTLADLGSHTYTIVEVDDGQAGFTYDNKEVTVTVNVTDNGDGTLTATPSYSSDANFANTYAAAGSVSLGGRKTLNGRILAENQFAFNLLDSGNNVIRTAQNDASGNFTFDAVDYTLADVGSHTYTIIEVNDAQAGYTYDSKEVAVTVTVTDNGDGTLTATPRYNIPANFSNAYAATGSVTLGGTKTLNGGVPANGQFTFNLLDSGDNVIRTAQNDAFGNFTFSALQYTQADVGSHTYYIVEADDGQAGYTYDNREVRVIVTVIDNGDGTLTATPSYNIPADFENTYEAAGSVTLGGSKTLNGRILTAGQFTFNLLDAGRTTILTAQNDALGNFAFDPIHYTLADVGSRTYYIVERDDGQAGYTYDSREIRVIVTVVDNGDGTLTATPNYTTSADFTNTYAAAGSATIGGTKTLNGGVPANGQFTFNLLDSGRTIILTAQNDAEGKFAFDPIHYTLADVGSHTYYIVEADDGQAGYTYDNREVRVIVTVIDNGDGTLTATPSYNIPADFENIYEAAGSAVFGGTKALHNGTLADGQFAFNLLNESRTAIRTTRNDAAGNFTFPAVNFTEADLGRTHTFYIAEVNDGQAGITYDNHECVITVTLTDNGDGTLTPNIEYAGGAAFVNTVDPRISVSVTKIWVDEAGNHPASLYVQLYRDGIAYESAVLLNAANNWTHTWTDLLDAHTWTVDELRVPNGYTKRVTRSGNDWTITNVRTPLPKTGDDSRLFLWLSVMALGAAGIVGVALYISKKRQRG